VLLEKTHIPATLTFSSATKLPCRVSLADSRDVRLPALLLPLPLQSKEIKGCLALRKKRLLLLLPLQHEKGALCM
jgi:hypothetical protein